MSGFPHSGPVLAEVVRFAPNGTRCLDPDCANEATIFVIMPDGEYGYFCEPTFRQYAKPAEEEDMRNYDGPVMDLTGGLAEHGEGGIMSIPADEAERVLLGHQAEGAIANGSRVRRKDTGTTGVIVGSRFLEPEGIPGANCYLVHWDNQPPNAYTFMSGEDKMKVVDHE